MFPAEYLSDPALPMSGKDLKFQLPLTPRFLTGTLVGSAPLPITPRPNSTSARSQ